MNHWSLTLHGPGGILSQFESPEAQFVLGTEEATDVLTVSGEGIAARHAWVWVVEGRMQVEDLAGGTLVNGHPIEGRVEADYPASVQVGEVTLVVEVKAAAVDSSVDVTIPQRTPTRSASSTDVTIPEKTPSRGGASFKSQPLDDGISNKAPLRGEYTLVKEIARGGMGQIYFGEDPQLERQVAVKVSSISEGGEDPRFSKEAKVLAHLAHPNIVPIYAIGVDAHCRPFYSMKLVKGRTLQAVLNALREGEGAAVKEYPRATLLTVFRKVCDAMAFAHAKGVLHRDLKPENIMVGEYGEVLVMDWGLAKVLGGKEVLGGREDAAGSVKAPAMDTGDYGVTLEGEVMGTPQYMSPEQAEGMVAELDARSDIYSLGGILYAILTLRPPVDGNTLNEVLTKVKKGELSAMATKRSQAGTASAGAPVAMGEEVPEALQAVTLKAMATDRNKRYASVEGFAADIEAYQNGFATSAEHAGFARQIVLLIKRNRAVSGLCAVLLVSAMVFSLRLIASERTARANEQRAVQERAAAQVSSAKAQIALAQSEHQAGNPQEMRRILDEVPSQYRDQHWSYLDAKLAPPAISFDIPEAPIEAVFPTKRASGCFIALQRNGDVRYLDPIAGFGSPLFKLSGPLKDLAFAFFEDEERAWLAVVTNRSARFGDRNYAASLEVLEVQGGASVYKVGLDRPCSSVNFSPQGNLLCLGRRLPAPAPLEMRNAYSGGLLWEGGEKDTVSSAFAPGEKLLVCSINGKGFQDLDCWTGIPEGPRRNGFAYAGYAGVWSAKADRFYHTHPMWYGVVLRGVDPRDGSKAFENLLVAGNGARVSASAGGHQLFVLTLPSANARVIDLLNPWLGYPLYKAYLLGNYRQIAAHPDEVYSLCFGDKKAAFQRWDVPASRVPDLPQFKGPFYFLKGDSKVAAATSLKSGKVQFKIFDLTKPKGESGSGASFLVRSSICSNQAHDLFSFMGDSPPGECVIARLEPNGLRQVARWKAASTPQLSPSGDRAWTKEALYDTATGKVLQRYERRDLGWPMWGQWVDEKTVLELVSMKRKTEEEVDELDESTFVLWEADTGKILLKLLVPRASTFGVSPDGLWIAEGSEDGRLRIRSARTLEVQHDYKVHDGGVGRVVWHPEKPVVVTVSRDSSLRAWDVRDGRMLQDYRCWEGARNCEVGTRGDLIGVGYYLGNSSILPLDLSQLRE